MKTTFQTAATWRGCLVLNEICFHTTRDDDDACGHRANDAHWQRHITISSSSSKRFLVTAAAAAAAAAADAAGGDGGGWPLTAHVRVVTAVCLSVHCVDRSKDERLKCTAFALTTGLFPTERRTNYVTANWELICWENVHDLAIMFRRILCCVLILFDVKISRARFAKG